MNVEACLTAMETAVADADAELVTVLGGHREAVQARLWRGRVLVDWEPDDSAGGVLLRPQLVRRLVALHAEAEVWSDELSLRAPGRSIAALSPEHADLVSHMGGVRRIVLRARLRFPDGVYRGGEEAYEVRGQAGSAPLLTLRAIVKPRLASPHTSPAPT